MTKTIPLVVAILCCGRISSAQMQTWTFSTGKPIEAELLIAQPGKVWLRRTDGDVFSIDMKDLGKADQQYIQTASQTRVAKKPLPPDTPGRISYGPGRKLCELADSRVNESSGLASSRHNPGLFWTHNDSGDAARLYVFNAKGRTLGSCLITGVMAYDWEDIVSFESEGKSYLMACDVGNNGRAAPVQMLHLIEEPKVDLQRGLAVTHVPLARTIYYSYEDDHRDCEAVAVDPTDKSILLVSKEPGTKCYAYVLPWPKSDVEKAWVAKLAGRLDIPTATAMDVSPDGLRAIVLTYGNAYEFLRQAKETWTAAFSRPPREIIMPQRVQGESICYGPDAKTLYLTSEKLPTPFWEVPVVEKP